MSARFAFKFVLICSCVAMGIAQAQVSLSYRESTINYNYLYGWSTDLHQDNQTLHDYGQALSGNMSAHHAGQTSGSYLGIYHWTAGATGDFAHDYSIGGSLSNISSITASASSNVTNFATQDGMAESDSENPGNLLMFEFDVSTNIAYSLAGQFSGTNAYHPAYLALQRWDGFAWQYIATNYFDSSANGTLFGSGMLNTGHYRMVSQLSVQSFYSNENEANGLYNYTLQFGNQPVPEPSTMALIGLAAIAARHRIKKANRS